ncbi:MAG: nitroreductase family protein [Chloroflexota bacterium]
MEFQDVIRKRKMYRSYLDKPVDPETIDLLLENAIRAPSAGFSQGWGFLVLDTPDDTRRFWEMNWDDRDQNPRWQTMENAPVIIIPMANKKAYIDRYAEPDKGWTDRDEGRWPTPFWITDTSFAAMNILLTVVDQGLGALFFGIRDIPRFRKTFNVPEEYEPIGAISIGHPDPSDRPSPSLKRGRTPISEVVRRGNWSE